MIETNELRIGNIVDSNNGLVKVIGLSKNFPYFEAEPYPHKYELRPQVSEIFPAVITEEWTKKLMLGPDLSPALTEHVRVFQFICPPFDRLILKLSGEVKLMNGATDQVIIKGVHHLQNIYLDLTGIELLINYLGEDS